MSELGDLLELLYRARSSWQTVHVVTNHWVHHSRSQRAFERESERRAGGASHAQFAYGEAVDFPVESSWRVERWLERSGRLREVHEAADHVLTTVSDGEHTWTYTPQMRAIVYDARTAGRTRDPVVDPSVLIVSAELEPLDPVEAAGRSALAVRAIPRQNEHFFPDVVPPGADDVHVLVDRERGVLLRIEASIEGERFHLVEVESISFDEALPPNTFVFEPPPGEEIRAAEDACGATDLTLAEVAQRSSFTIYAPRKLVGNWRIVAVHRPASERPRVAESVHLVFHDDALHHFAIEEGSEPALGWRRDPATVVERNGFELRVFEGERFGPPAEVQLERDGTYVRLSSDNLPVESLLDVAASLAPASTEPPPIVA